LSVKLKKKQIIIVDDFSIDKTRKILNKKIFLKAEKIIFHKKNLGKGAAIKSAQKYVTGDVVIIQDADLEYNPSDYNKLIEPIINSFHKVVYGSRVLNKKRYFDANFISSFRVFGNHMLTIFSNIVNKQNLTDAHTCYKVFHKSIFKKLNLNENSFNFCPEVTTKISNMNINIIEVPIKYKGRDYNEGKKINFIDAFYAVFTILRYKFFKN
jgi:glycosyltransferase involved in cell wall biosynthesis